MTDDPARMAIPRSVMVAGGRGLIGSALASHLTSSGWIVHALDAQDGQDLADEVFLADFFSSHTVDAVITAAGTNHSANEGAGAGKSYLDYSVEDINAMLSSNVALVYSLSRHFILNSPSGVLLNFSSIHAVTSPVPGQYAGGDKHPMYGPSKAAVESLTRYLAAHAGERFRINCIRLGGVEDAQSDEFKRAYAGKTVMGRMALTSDVADLVDFLLSPSSSYMTGQTLTLDGGWGLSP